ncbi:hypothetical protein DW979_11485 [Eubacterium sp. AM49-13BH]|jgi:hypothetical protein|nr:hypothetical protein DW979_11485 [Eubacterium sp. AM49-13BH]
MKDLLVLIGYESDNDFANGFADIINKLKILKLWYLLRINVMSKDFHQQDFYMCTLTDIKRMR